MPIPRIAGMLALLLMTACASLERAPSPAETTPGTQAPRPAPTRESDATTPAKPASPGTAEQDPKRAKGVDSTKQAALDLATLEKRLRETEAIGAFTKLALKNQVDDLVEQFREVHQRRGKPTQLRQSYDLLFLKVLSLLQDGDPALAKAIVASREAIWGILADPVKFSSI